MDRQMVKTVVMSLAFIAAMVWGITQSIMFIQDGRQVALHCVAFVLMFTVAVFDTRKLLGLFGNNRKA